MLPKNTLNHSAIHRQYNVSDNSISSGVFSILKSGTDTEIDEIWLHTVNKASTSYHIFARVSGTKLQVACTAAGAKTLTIKIKRLI